MLYTKILTLYNRIQFWKFQFTNELLLSFLEKTIFIRDYYKTNDLIWQDGFLIDFLQKKVVDKWMRKFLIYSAFLYSERLVFDYVVRFYIDLLIWPGHKNSIFEFNNVSSTLLITLFLLLVIFLILSLSYVYILFL